MAFLELARSGAPNNFGKYQNPAYDALLDRIDRERDATTRDRLICAAEKVLNRDLPIWPLYFQTRAYLKRPWVEGWEPQYLDQHLIKYVRFAN